jgi:hypothetical protein
LTVDLPRRSARRSGCSIVNEHSRRPAEHPVGKVLREEGSGPGGHTMLTRRAAARSPLMTAPRRSAPWMVACGRRPGVSGYPNDGARNERATAGDERAASKPSARRGVRHVTASRKLRERVSADHLCVTSWPSVRSASADTATILLLTEDGVHWRRPRRAIKRIEDVRSRSTGSRGTHVQRGRHDRQRPGVDVLSRSSAIGPSLLGAPLRVGNG